MAIVFTFSTSMQDDKNTSQMLIASLPVSRQETVTAAYAFQIGIGLGLVVLAGAIQLLLGKLPFEVARSQALVAAAVIATFVSVFFPLYYRLGARFVQIGLLIVFLMFITVVSIVYSLVARYNLWGLQAVVQVLQQLPFAFLLATATIILLLASWRVSVWLYGRKEF